MPLKIINQKANSILDSGFGFNLLNMIVKYIFVLFTSVMVLAFGLPKNILKKVTKEIEKTFNVEQFQLNSKTFSSNITDVLPASFAGENLFEITTSDNLRGYAYVSKAQSKTDYFDFLILFDKDFIIIKSKVLAYREDYGGEIGSKRWLKQFIGKSQNDTLNYGDNIMAISGATISVRSMTNAINNVLASIKILHQKNLL
jgi:Na+-translocating ferredoxin:NAD+ oxidoreductase RnfG subunit